MNASIRNSMWIKIFSCIALLALLILSACSKEEDPTPEELYLRKLTFAWQLKAASVDEKDVLTHFNGLVLQIKSDYTYQVTNPVPGLWPASGTFQLEQVDDENFNVRRNDGVLISVIALSENELKLKFQYAASAKGRASSVGGKYQFTFGR